MIYYYKFEYKIRIQIHSSFQKTSKGYIFHMYLRDVWTDGCLASGDAICIRAVIEYCNADVSIFFTHQYCIDIQFRSIDMFTLEIISM